MPHNTINGSTIYNSTIGSTNVINNYGTDNAASFAEALQFLKEQSIHSSHPECRKLCKRAYNIAEENGKTGLAEFINKNKRPFLEKVLIGVSSTAIINFFKNL